MFYTLKTFNWEKIEIGDLLDDGLVSEFMDILPPACMRADCSQIGEPYDHKIDENTGKIRPTYGTFKVVSGTYPNRVWEYCGHCFRGENVERGKEIPRV